MKTALIVGQQPLYRLAIADLLRKSQLPEIHEEKRIEGFKNGLLQGADLLIICVPPGDQQLLKRLDSSARMSGCKIVLFTQEFGKRHRRLLLKNKVDLCLPLSVHCSVAENYLAEMIAHNGCATVLRRQQEDALKLDFKPDLYDLSNSERVVLSHLQEGLSNRAIAERMNLQLNTVKVHLARACRKAGFTNRTHAAMMTHDLVLCGA
ncbi:MAG: LuxR C-terminal-related transcriptional regulator [Motiliproteus sp.]|nr:LuxR C-terminal-related transcriptional regulator [Motiliproteus sp.]MCW9052727.1 LuxR C-terminal-related transcriptional regulator [Motiliproteus sp.]